jgi:hypothetical protein
VITGGTGAALTVKIAGLAIALPAALTTETVYLPAFAGCKFVKVRVAVDEPETPLRSARAMPFKNHSYVSGSWLVAATDNTTLAPCITVCDINDCVITGAAHIDGGTHTLTALLDVSAT